MVGEEGEWQLGEKNEKGERKTEENYIKNGDKGLKNPFFWVKNFPPPAANSFVEGIK